MTAECRACGAAGEMSPAVVAAERMFGMGGSFAYDACARCGAVQLRDVPADLGRFYPSGYYAHSSPGAPEGVVRSVARRVRDRALYRGPMGLGWVSGMLSSTPRRLSRHWFSVTGVSRDSRILDVGCGRGQRLADLAGAGFRRLLGVDPYIDAPIRYGDAAVVLKGTIFEVAGDGLFDLVMFHHSLEHIEDQTGTLARAAALLRPGGWVLVRVPTVSSWAWERYGADWVQLDAPRHIVLHTVESLRMLGARCGLGLERVEYDSTEFQFLGSEGYRMGYTLAESYEAFPASAMREWRRMAYSLNHAGRGDQAAFFFRMPS